jgi:hypothetical protein
MHLLGRRGELTMQCSAIAVKYRCGVAELGEMSPVGLYLGEFFLNIFYIIWAPKINLYKL